MRTNRTRDIIIGIVVLLAILLTIYLIRRRQLTVTVNPSPVPTAVSQFEQNLQNTFNIKIPDNVIKVDLRDVTGSGNMGIATKDNQNKVFTVLANLDDPAPGYFYEAWLVNGTDTVPMGKLTMEKGGWLVNYTSPKDMSDHKIVWVTLEAVNDLTPEKHILEASF